jgi:hypothetical protein
MPILCALLCPIRTLENLEKITLSIPVLLVPLQCDARSFGMPQPHSLALIQDDLFAFRDVVVSRVPSALQPAYFVGRLVMAEVEFRTMESRLATNHCQGRCVAAISCVLVTYAPLIGQFQFSSCD